MDRMINGRVAFVFVALFSASSAAADPSADALLDKMLELETKRA